MSIYDFPYVYTRKVDNHEIMVLAHVVNLWVDDRVDPVVCCTVEDAKQVAKIFEARGHECDIDVEYTNTIDLTELDAEARAAALCPHCMERYAWARPVEFLRPYVDDDLDLCRPCDDSAYAEFWSQPYELVKARRDERYGPAADHSNVR